MKKNMIIIGAFVVVTILGIFAIIRFSQTEEKKPTVQSGKRECTVSSDVYTDEDNSSPAAKISQNEVRLTCENFAAEIDEFKGVAVVDMYSPTCPHCQKMGPVFAEAAVASGDKYKFAKIDVTKYREIGTEFNIESVPALLYFKDGKEVDRVVGEQSKAEILAKLEAAATK